MWRCCSEHDTYQLFSSYNSLVSWVFSPFILNVRQPKPREIQEGDSVPAASRQAGWDATPVPSSKGPALPVDTLGLQWVWMCHTPPMDSTRLVQPKQSVKTFSSLKPAREDNYIHEGFYNYIEIINSSEPQIKDLLNEAFWSFPREKTALQLNYEA